MKKIKGVIFDLDGTIADTLPLCIAAFRKSVEPLAGRSITDQEIIATFGPSEEGTISALVPQHYEKGVASYLHIYETLHHTCNDPFPGIAAILADLKSKRIKIAMVTGKGTHSTAVSLKQFQLNEYFEIIETGSPEGPRKADGIRNVLTIWNTLHQDEVIYIGDSPNDIVASKQAGIAVVAAAWADTAEPEKLVALEPDFIFYTVDDFANWLRSNVFSSE